MLTKLTKAGRILSLINFAGVILLIAFYPYAFKSIVGTSRYGFMSFTIMIACLAAINAIGYKPESRFWRIIIHPIFTVIATALLLYGMFR
ncbi:MAG: hypothetical protein LBH40_05820 [Alphaproteobacteria bacterium]|jgi:predicted membrane protein|nr:hypothetical protein [Alphaproteobacteria bacterium]